MQISNYYHSSLQELIAFTMNEDENIRIYLNIWAGCLVGEPCFILNTLYSLIDTILYMYNTVYIYLRKIRVIDICLAKSQCMNLYTVVCVWEVCINIVANVYKKIR